MEIPNSEMNIIDLIQDSNRNFIENELIQFLKIPSNTLNSEGIEKAKDYIISYIFDISEEIKVYEGEINPIILAKIEGELKEQLLIYMMYDTQPISKDKEWISNPFGADLKILPAPLNKLGDCIIARGAYNSKTPLLCFLNIVKILKDNQCLPVSLILLFDGEEEKGSPSLLKFLENSTNRKIFSNCIDAYYPSTKQDINGNLVLKLGYKGILSITIIISTRNEEPHSAFSSMIPNPATDLVSLLNTIYSNNQFQIDSLKKQYRITDDEQSLIDFLMEEVDIESIKQKAGIKLAVEDDPYKAFLNYLFNPTFNISTLKSGYLKEGSKNFVPNHALCNIDIRFAHNVTIKEIFNEIKEKVDNFSHNTKAQIQITKNLGYESSRVQKDSLLVRSLKESAEVLGISTEIWPLSAAAAPLSKIQKELNLNFLTGGLGIGGFAHSTNEFIQYDSIINTRLANYHFLKIYSDFLKEINGLTK
ncbi:MAG: M20/M25/M40 family metallo-hydrolase [Candidatus Thorarchaeota archaeon]